MFLMLIWDVLCVFAPPFPHKSVVIFGLFPHKSVEHEEIHLHRHFDTLPTDCHMQCI